MKDIEGGGIRIEKYINNTLESDDYWDEKGNTISIAQLLMKDKLRVTRTKGNREKPVILQCSKCEGVYAYYSAVTTGGHGTKAKYFNLETFFPKGLCIIVSSV